MSQQRAEFGRGDYRSARRPRFDQIGESSGDERPAAEFIVDWFEDNDIDAKLVYEPYEDRPQVVAEVGSGDPTLVLNGHTDVYPAGDTSRWEHPPYAAEIEDGKLYGRGSADMKLGVTLAMLTARDLKPEIESGSSRVDTLSGARWTGNWRSWDDGSHRRRLRRRLRRRSRANADAHCHLHKGLVVRYHGQREPGHSARPDSGRNAIEEAHPLLTRLLEYDEELRTQTNELVGPAYANLTQIEGGLTGNMIPEEVTVRLERRFSRTRLEKR
ncbi:M20 family peptidase [Natrialba swarupiae]|nr:M20 family peptidase [Natrialba swarupiae]